MCSRGQEPVHDYLEAVSADGQATHRAMVQRLKPLRVQVHTITYDNGKEFAGHRQTTQRLCTQVFFAPLPITRGNGG
ncbi:MAG: hypothetical protein FJ244_09285 [Nitrospira sp.]|nr:hypothetical protein [Nitrospira sp.]